MAKIRLFRPLNGGWDYAKKFLKYGALLPIKAYRTFISPAFAPHCRFYPTCSAYAEQAISRFGLYSGGLLALKRLLRCHPFCKGGIDEVPQTLKNI